MAHEYRIGVQSVVFDDWSLEVIANELEAVDIEWIEIWDRHCSPDEYDPDVVRRTLGEHGVSIAGYGVVDLDDTGIAREYAAFADRLGVAYLTVNYQPTREDITRELLELAEEFDIDIAIHNYSSIHHDDLSMVSSSMADVENVLTEYEHPRLGVCVDTGHFLIEAVDPAEVIATFGKRITAVHLKDTSETEIEGIPGAGQLDLSALFDLLDKHADLEVPLVIEYELPEDCIESGLQEGVRNVRIALNR